MTRRFCRGVVLITGLVLALVSARPTEAGIVTVNFSGTVTSIDDPSGYISGTNLGDSFSGTLVYNSSATVDLPGANPAHYTFLPNGTNPFVAPLGITLTVGSHTFSTLYTGLMQLTVQNDLASSNYPDAFGAVADVKVGNTFSLAGFVLGDKTGTVFSSTALPTSLDLSQFTVGEVNLVSPSANGTNVFVGTINLSSVPEPASMTLMALGVIGAAAWSLGRSAFRQRGSLQSRS
jgi:hypothetical protein